MKSVIAFLFFISFGFTLSYSQSVQYPEAIIDFTDSLALEINSLKIRERNQRNIYSTLIDNLNKRIDSLVRENEKLENQLQMSIKSADSLRKNLSDTKLILHDKIKRIDEDFQKTKRGNASLLIIVFSLIALLFIYFFFRDYKLEKLIDKKIIIESMETDNKFQSIQKKWKRSFAKLLKKTKKKKK